MEFMDQIARTQKDAVIHLIEHNSQVPEKCFIQASLQDAGRTALKRTENLETSFSYHSDSNKFVSSVYIHINNSVNKNNNDNVGSTGDCYSRTIKLPVKECNNRENSNTSNITITVPVEYVACNNTTYTSSGRDGSRNNFHNTSDNKQFDTIVTMATATGEARSVASTRSLSQDTATPVFPSITLGTFRVINRGSRTMLSEGGLLLSPPPSQTSPLVQIAADINTSLLLSRNNSSRHASDRTTSPTSTEGSYKSISAKDNIRDTLNPFLAASFKEASHPGTGLEGSMSQKKRPNVTIFQSPSSSLAENSSQSETQKGSTFLQGMSARMDDKKMNTLENSAPSQWSGMTFSQRYNMHETSQITPSVDFTEERNIVKRHSLALQVDDTKHTLDSHRPYESNIEPNLVREGERVDSKSASTYKGHSNIAIPKPRSLSLKETGAELTQTERYKNDQNNEKSKWSNIDNVNDQNPLQTLETQKQTKIPPGPTQKTKSKFLTELYTGAEKIKKFINKGKMKKESNKLTSWSKTSHSENTNEVTSGTLEVHQSDVNHFQNSGNQRVDGGEEINSTLNSKVFPGRSLSESPFGLATSVITNKSRDVKEPINSNDVFNKPKSNFIEQSLSEDGDNDVFSPSILADLVNQTSTSMRRHSFSGCLIPKRNLIDMPCPLDDSPVSTISFHLNENEHVPSDLVKRRVSLPDNVFLKQEVAVAFNKASIVHQKYSSGIINSSAGPTSLRRRSNFRHLILGDSSQLTLTTASAGLVFRTTKVKLSPGPRKLSTDQIDQPSMGTLHYNKIVMKEDGKPSTHINQCQSEAELSAMLSTCTDVDQGRQIRARIRDLKVRRQNMAGDDGDAPDQRSKHGSVKHTPITTSGVVNSSISRGSIDTKNVVDDTAAYEGIRSLAELQKLLSQTSDPGERYQIRNAIRKLRHRPESDRFNKARQPIVQQDVSPAGQPELHRANTTGSSYTAHLSEELSECSLCASQSHHSSADSHNSLTQVVAEIPSFSSTTLHSITNYSNVHLNEKPAYFTALNVSETQTSGVHDNTSSKSYVVNVGKQPQSDYDNSETLSSSIIHNKGDSKSVSIDDDVSSVLNQVKARLKSRSDSVSSDIKSPHFLQSPYEGRSQPTPESAFKSEGESIFSFQENVTENKEFLAGKDTFSSPYQDKLPERASARYRETRNEILKCAKISELYNKTRNPSIVSESPFASSRQEGKSSQLASRLDFKPSTHLRSEDCAVTGDTYKGTQTAILFPTLLKESIENARREACTNTTSESIKEDHVRSENKRSRGCNDDHFLSPTDRAILAVVSERQAEFYKPSSGTIRSQTITSTKNYKLQTVNAPKPDKKDTEYDELTDFEKLERGQRPSKSRSLVSSLAAKFDKYGKENTQYQGSTLRRSQSLNTRVAHTVNAKKSEINFMVAGVSVQSGSDATCKERGSHYSIPDTNSQVAHLVKDTSSQSFGAYSLSTAFTVLQPNNVTGDNEIVNRPSNACDFIDSKQRPTNIELETCVEAVDLTPKPKLRRAKPLVRSFTESHITRPRKYTSHIELHPLPQIIDKVEPNDELFNESRKKTYEIGTEIVASDDTHETSENDIDMFASDDLRFNTRSNITATEVESKSPAHVNVFEECLDERSLSEARITVAEPFSTQDSGNKGHLWKLTEIGKSSFQQKLKSDLGFKQPTPTMEHAFSLLLEELDKISSSEGNPSDLDLSDGEDLMSVTSSPGIISNNEPTFDIKDPKVIGDGIPGLHSYSSASVESRKYIKVHKTDTDLHVSEGESGTESVAQTFNHASRSKNDLGLGLCVEDGLDVHVRKNEVTSKSLLSTVSLSPSALTSSTQSSSEVTAGDRVTTLNQPGESTFNPEADMPGQQVKQASMDIDTIDGHVNNNNNISTFTTEMSSVNINDPPRNVTNFLGTHTFNVNEDEDGTITMQAVAEDHNQNHIVTVRTKTQRTPSNANEELRDTIVEKMKLSSEGTLVVEKDVVTTKKRLTSRGSNYFTRSAFTTTTRRDRAGSETVEHNVSVETDNKSVSQGHSWGDKAVAQIVLEDANNSVGPQTFIVTPTIPSELINMSSEYEAVVKPSQDMWETSSFGTSNDYLRGPIISNDGQHRIHGNRYTTEEYKRGSQNLPVFDKGLSDVTVTEGHSITLSCIVSQATSVDWHKDGILQKSSTDFKQTFDGREARLEIVELSLEDNGEYACVIKNQIGDRKSSCILTVKECELETHVVPMFLTKPSNRALYQGEPLLLECDVIGSPEPTITWLKDGKELRPYLTFSTSYDGRVASLQVHAMSIEDSGCYMCVAENPAGKVSMEANVTVQVKNEAPSFISKLEDISVLSGTNIVLQCEINGTPQPSISWRKNGRLIQASHNVVQSCNNGKARLEIVKASGEDSADYECVARNVVSDTSSQCHVQVTDTKALQARETTAPREDQIVTTLPKLTRHRVFKKLSEPRPADIISAVIQRASSQGLRRAETFTPGSSSVNRDNIRLAIVKGDISSSSCPLELHRNTQRPPETLSETRDRITVSSRSGSDFIYSQPSNASIQVELPQSIEKTKSSISRTASLKLPESQPIFRITNLSRSSSVKVAGRHMLTPKSDNLISGRISPFWEPPSNDQINPREAITKSLSNEVITDCPPSSYIAGYRPVSPRFFTTTDKNKLSPSPRDQIASNSGIDSSENYRDTITLERATLKEKELDTPSTAVSTISTFISSRSTLESSVPVHTSELRNIPADSSLSSFLKLHSTSTQKSAADVPSEDHKHIPFGKVQAPSVSSLRQQFLKNDELVATDLQNNCQGNSATNVRRWHSLPPRDTKPTVFQRKSVLNTTRYPIMPSYQEINDEEELHKMMNATEDFDERKKIRARLREIRDKQREEQEAKRKQREAEAEDLVKKKFERAEEEKRKKMEAYKQQAPTHERDSKYHEVSQNLIQEKYKAAEEEKAKKMAAYSSMASSKAGPGGSDYSSTRTTTSTTVEKAPGGGTRTVTQTTTESKETKGFGGTSYGKPAEVTARELTAKLMRSSGPGVIGHITVRTEAWNSTDGLVEKSEKSHSWGAKPQGAKSAMAAFKQMDNANPDGAAKPNGLISVSLAKKAASTMKRNVVAIKQEILNFCKQNVAEYEGVEITNFSASWNNGMAFCALIHHFFPNAFDFSKLDPKQRRYNFTLAFDTAEKEADIAPLLDVDDMVKMKNPDWKCVFTYVQSIYRHLKDHENNKAGPIEQ